MYETLPPKLEETLLAIILLVPFIPHFKIILS